MAGPDGVRSRAGYWCIVTIQVKVMLGRRPPAPAKPASAGLARFPSARLFRRFPDKVRLPAMTIRLTLAVAVHDRTIAPPPGGNQGGDVPAAPQSAAPRCETQALCAGQPPR